MKHLLPLTFAGLLFASLCSGQATSPYTTCPDVNIAIARAGTNADITNPYYLYNVDPETGGLTQVPGGGFKDPASPTQNLQVNGVGVNTTDGYMYGLVYDGTVNTSRFVRLDKNYGVTVLGDIAPPISSTGLLSFINSAAGDVDRLNNYYFTANTANVGGAGVIIDKLFLGMISNLSTLSGAPNAVYHEIDFTDLNCSAFITSLNTDPNNSGLKDFSYSPFTNTFFTYATYKNPGAATFSGQLIELRPIAGTSPLKYKMYCNAFINTTTAETSGTFIDKVGNFEVLFTDGSVKRMQSGATPYVYTGVLLPLNNATGLPAVIRGDMASCGNVASAPLPVTLNSFNASGSDCNIRFTWSVQNQMMKEYELEQSFDFSGFTTMAHIKANSASSSAYSFVLPSPGKPAYYRLKMTDNTDRLSYSQVVSVNDACNKAAGFVINPNPVSEMLNLRWYRMPVSDYTVEIFNTIGMKLLSAALYTGGGSVSTINVANLSPGTYFVKVTDVKGSASLQQKFVKQ